MRLASSSSSSRSPSARGCCCSWFFPRGTVVVVYVVVVVVYVYVALGLVVFLLRQRFVVLVFNFLSLRGFADRVADATSTATTILYCFRRVAETIIATSVPL